MNHLFIILDSVRYDNFQEAKTPNFDKLGPTKKAYSTSCWTLPSIFNLLCIGSHIGANNLLPNKPPEWVPTKYKKNGFTTIFLNSNPWILTQRNVFNRDFNYFVDYDFDGKQWPLERMINSCVDKIYTLKLQEQQWFIFMLVMDTHFYEPIKGFRGGSQIKAIEIADNLFEPLFKQLKNTQVTITSDHGETEQGHNPMTLKEFSKDLFEVPIIQGVIE